VTTLSTSAVHGVKRTHRARDGDGLVVSPGALTDQDLPGLFTAADRVSIEGQRKYIRAVRGRLGLGVVAAALSLRSLSLGGLNATALLAALAFLGALAIELWLLAEKPERHWYDGRAIAESSKTLAWRYSIGAEPFPLGLSASREVFLAQLGQLLKDAPDTGITASANVAISTSMDELRRASLDRRREVYLGARIADQRDWYGRKSVTNGELAKRWSLVLVAVEVLGLVAALGRGVGLYEIDAASLFAALLGVAGTWIGVKQFRSLQRAYAFANQELNIIYSRLSRTMSESEWASEAADAEEAISREHTMWRASRSSLGLP
jgi:hypothetical protein